MSNLKIVSVRIKDNSNKGTKLATSSDVAFYMKGILDNHQKGDMFLINLNKQNRVINIFDAKEEFFKMNIGFILSESILSNAVNCIIVSKGESKERDNILESYTYMCNLLGINLKDWIYENDESKIISMKSKGMMIEEPKLKKVTISKNQQKVDLKNEEFVKLKLKTEKIIKEVSTKEEAILKIQEDLSTLDREAVYVLSLDKKGKPLNATINSIGIIDEALTTMREMFKTPILSKAESIVIIHNHPSGKTKASIADIKLTKVAETVGNIIGIKMEDHFIVSGETKEIRSIKEDVNRYYEYYSDEKENELDKLLSLIEEKGNKKVNLYEREKVTDNASGIEIELEEYER